jgi:hypothetical protein
LSSQGKKNLKTGRSLSRPAWAKRENLMSKRTGGMAQMVQYLPIKHKVPSSDPSTIKRRKKKTKPSYD